MYLNVSIFARCWFSFRRKTKAESDLKSELDALFENAIREKYQKLKSLGQAI